MLVHICCSVDSHFFLQKLRKTYPDEKLVGFFYDPNIHPYSEYRLRLLDVQRSCDMLEIPLIEGAYDYLGWIEAVRGLENEPEKGKRCEVCFDNRLETTAQKASELGEKSITTTLLTSPKKSQEQLKNAGEYLSQQYDVRFIAPDFRKGGGTQQQFQMAKEDKLYHQDYCGCIFGLTKQREQQQKLADELFSNVGKQILPESIEERIALYQKRVLLEKEGQQYRLLREKFLNYRLLRAWVKADKKVVPSYFVAYSTLKRKSVQGKIDFQVEPLHYFNRDEVVFLALKSLNELLALSYKSVQEMIFNPLKIEDEIRLREKLLKNFFSLSAIIILDMIEDKKYEIFCDTHTYMDVRENLVTF